MVSWRDVKVKVGRADVYYGTLALVKLQNFLYD